LTCGLHKGGYTPHSAVAPALCGPSTTCGQFRSHLGTLVSGNGRLPSAPQRVAVPPRTWTDKRRRIRVGYPMPCK
jgi:hypothetical protein